jgi:signal transduction histidine kinase
VDRCPEVAELTNDIMEEVDRVNGLISKVLAYTRPSDVRRERVDVGRLLEAARSRMCRGVCRIEPSSCELCRVHADRGLGSIEGDPVLLEQAVLNLVSNAREASPEGAPIELGARQLEDGQVELTVSDRGPGVADEDRHRVFEPFFTRRPDGVGLGLPAVQKIADLHQGSIRLEPRDGGGTVARLRLPASGASRPRGGA